MSPVVQMATPATPGTPGTGLKTKYPWNDTNRLQLVTVVRVVRGEGKTHGLKWKEVARRVHNDSDLEEIMFGRLCAKQYDNLYRAYTKYKQDGEQPPRLTTAVISEFDQLFPKKAAVVKPSGVVKAPGGGGAGVTKASRGGAGLGGASLLDVKSSGPGEAMRGKFRGRKGHQLKWSNITRINLLTAVRVVSTKEGKIKWTEVAAYMPNDFGVSEERLCSLCMKQFTDLSTRYKEFKMMGTRPRRLSPEIIQNMDELYDNFPNLNPVPEGAQLAVPIDLEEPSLSSPAASEHDGVAPRYSSEPSSGVKDAPPPAPEPAPASTSVPASTPPCTPVPAPDSNRGEGETGTVTRDISSVGKRKERTEASSSKTADRSTPEDYIKDDQEVGFDRVERELVQLNSWLKQEVLPVGKEVLTRVQAYGRRNQTGKRSKTEPHDDFDKLIYEASQKSTVLFIRAQFQQARANILKEVKETIERVGMDLLHRRTNPLENNNQAALPGHSQEGAV